MSIKSKKLLKKRNSPPSDQSWIWHTREMLESDAWRSLSINARRIVDDKNHYMIGGTGKYKGITGTVPYTVVELHDTVGGRSANIVNHKAAWEIK